MRNMRDSRIEYLRNESNSGVSASRNRGIQNSNGVYIGFLDDDDEWLPEKLEKQVTLFENLPEAGAVYTGVFSADITNDEILEVVIPNYRGNVLYEIIVSNFISTSSILVRKKSFDVAGLFDEELTYGEDMDMWIRIAKECTIEFIPKVLIKHKDHQNALSSNTGNMARNLERIIEKHKVLFESNKRGLGNCLFKVATAYCCSGDIAKGKNALIKSIKAYPFDIRLYYNLALVSLGACTEP